MSEMQSLLAAPNWRDFQNLLARSRVILEGNEQAIKEVSELQRSKLQVQVKMDKLRKTINRCTEIFKDVQQNLEEKKRVSLEEYNSCIQEVNSIVKSSDMTDMVLKIDRDRAIVVDRNQQDVNEREGSAARSSLGLLMRYTSLIKQPTTVIPMMLFDETFFTMSDNTCEEVRDYITEFSNHCLIIAIEQRDTLFNGIDDKTVYTFVKGDDGVTKIRKEE